MKKIHFLFCLLLLQLSLSNLAYGQIYPNEAEAARIRDDIPRNAPLVFEGYLIDRHIEYVGKDHQVYFSELVMVEKVLRGNIQLGYVEIQSRSWNTVDSTGKISNIRPPHDGVDLSMPNQQDKVTFFCKWTKEPNVILDLAKQNMQQVALYDFRAGHITHRELDNWKHWWRLGGFTNDEDYQAFMSKYGLGDKPAPPTVIKITPPYQKKSKDGKNPLSIDGKSVMFYDLMLDMINPITTISGSNTFFEFDVVGNANGTPSYLDSLRLQFNYNTAAFGSNISATE